MFELLPFQEEVLKLLEKRQKFLLADDCGLGKTIVGVEVARKFARGPVLVVAPRLVKEWWAEVITKQDAGYVKVCGQAGRDVDWAKLARWNSEGKRAFVIVHPAAVRISGRKMANVRWEMIVIDEAHRFKNRKAQQTKALFRLQAPRKLLLTATPYGQSPADLWSLLHWLNPQEFSSFWNFFEAYVDYYQPYGQRFRKVKGAKHLDKLARVIAPYYLKRTKQQVGYQLPPISYTDVPVALEKEQHELYRKLVRDSYALLEDKEVILENALVRILRLQQCALDPGLLADDLSQKPLGSKPAKVEWIDDWLEDNPDEPVIIVSRFRTFVERWLRDLSPKATIVGGMSQQQVNVALKRFRETGRLVGTLDVLKEGMNLQRASTIIVTDGTWSATSEYQLSQRIHRIGQKSRCQIIHLVGRVGKKFTVDKLIRNSVTKRLNEAAMVDQFIKELKGDTT